MISRNRRLFKNSVLLVAVQIVSYLAQLLILPRLTRVLTVDGFGAVMTVMAAISVAYVVTDYGFTLSATHKIAQKKDDKKYIVDFISVVFSAKLVLVIFAVLAVISISFFSAYAAHRNLIFCGIAAILFQAFQPIWLLHGLGKMDNFTVYIIATRVLHVATVYLTVRGEGDGYLVLVSWSIANFVGCVVGLFFLIKSGHSIRFASIHKALRELKKNAHFFFSRIATAIYASAGILTLGHFSLQQAALYSAADHGYRAGQAIASAVGQALYPFMVSEKNWVVFRRVVTVAIIVICFGTAFVYYFANFFVTFIFGSQYNQSVPILRIMLVTLIINSMTVLFGYPFLAALNKLEWANKTTLIGAFLFLVLLGFHLLFMDVSARSFAEIVLLTEIVILALRIYPAFIKK